MANNFIEIPVEFETITPLWTGDAWMENREIRSSSIFGSLRFWFEVISLAKGWTSPEDYENGKLKANLDLDDKTDKQLANYKFLQQKLNEINNANTEIIRRIAQELKQHFAKRNHKGEIVSSFYLPDFIFGATRWKGLIRIKDIEFNKEDFGNNLNLPSLISISKDDYEILFDDRNTLRNRNYSKWFLFNQKENNYYFFGRFTIKFEVEENVLETIFHPLLKFIEHYGFLGGKWNLGYGRVRLNNINLTEVDDLINIDINEFSFFDSDEADDLPNVFNFLLGLNNDFDCYEQLDSLNDNFSYDNLHYFDVIEFNDLQDESLRDIISDLLLFKAQLRNCLRTNEDGGNLLRDLRHQVFGSTSGGTQGTKILPWITKDEDGQYQGGFISLVGLLNLK